MTSKLIRLAVAGLIAVCSIPANAAIVTWNYTAVVNFDNNSPFNLGDIVSGSITFDSASASTYSDSTTAIYGNALTSVTFNGNSLGPFSSERISISNNASFVSKFDSFAAEVEVGSWPNTLFFGLTLSTSQTSDFPVTDITSLNLPTIPYNFASFATHAVNLNKFTDGNIEFGVNAILTSLTPAAVPGPMIGAGLPGLLMAFGGLLAWRRRRNQATA